MQLHLDCIGEPISPTTFFRLKPHLKIGMEPNRDDQLVKGNTMTCKMVRCVFGFMALLSIEAYEDAVITLTFVACGLLKMACLITTPSVPKAGPNTPKKMVKTRKKAYPRANVLNFKLGHYPARNLLYWPGRLWDYATCVI